MQRPCLFLAAVPLGSAVAGACLISLSSPPESGFLWALGTPGLRVPLPRAGARCARLPTAWCVREEMGKRGDGILRTHRLGLQDRSANFPTTLAWHGRARLWRKQNEILK